jgi:GntR family transcriptional regulator of arabinose operon
VAQFYRICIESVKVNRFNLYLLNGPACRRDYARPGEQTSERRDDRVGRAKSKDVISGCSLAGTIGKATSPGTQVAMKSPKHQQIYKELLRAIAEGVYVEGQRLPSEAELVTRFDTSRPTVARALQRLQQQGVIERRVGSGSYVRRASAERSDLFALLIPGLAETEIFGPLCREMSRAAQTSRHALLWSDPTDEAQPQEEQAEQLCEQYIARKVSGVFFAPLEFSPNRDMVNQRICDAFDRAGIPVVLLDRDIDAFPRRSHYDVVGIDNRRAGFIVTDHLLRLGCRRIAFLSRAGSAPSVALRIAGYKEALASARITAEADWVSVGCPADLQFVRNVIEGVRPEAFVCANDDTAANLMHTLDELGLRIPEEVRIVGIDDVRYAQLLRVPLTTLRQPCQYIGAAALRAMLERIAQPDIPARNIFFECKLIVRESCGANMQGRVTLASPS